VFSNISLHERGLKLDLLRRPNEGPHYETDKTMAVPEPHWKQLFRLISCKRYHEFQANHFQPAL